MGLRFCIRYQKNRIFFAMGKRSTGEQKSSGWPQAIEILIYWLVRQPVGLPPSQLGLTQGDD
jgi:hypothetical protein